MERLWVRRRTTNAASIRSRSRGPSSPAPCRRGSPSARWTAVRTSLIARGIADPAPARSAVRPVRPGPGLHQGLSARRPRKRRPVHACRRVGGHGAGPARQRRRSRGIVPHAQPDQPHAHGRRGRRATRPSRTSWRAMSTRARRTPDAAAGAGTPARRPGCIGPASKACWDCGGEATRSASIPASLRHGRVMRSCGTWAARST